MMHVDPDELITDETPDARSLEKTELECLKELLPLLERLEEFRRPEGPSFQEGIEYYRRRIKEIENGSLSAPEPEP